MRVKVDWRSASKENYRLFCKTHKDVKLTFDEWRSIIEDFNTTFRDCILDTGHKVKLPGGFGQFSINKKKRRIKKGPNDEYINLPVDWKKSKEKGKKIYNFNYHTDGYFFGWMWFKPSASFKNPTLWYFKPTRDTSRLITHYINIDPKYKDMYCEWTIKCEKRNGILL